MPTGAHNIEGTLHVDRYLTNFSVSYVQDARNFVSVRAASRIPVQKQTDMYSVYDRGYFWRDEAKPRPLGGRPEQVGYKFTTQTYNAVEYALEHYIDDRQRANADDSHNLDQNAVSLLTQKMMIKADRLWATTMFTTGVWTNDITGVASVGNANTQFMKFSDANSDPIGVIDMWKDEMVRMTGFLPNTLVLGTKVKRTLRLHPDIADRIKYTRVGIGDEDVLSALFEVPNIVVARSVYNAADEGLEDDIRWIVPDDAFWLGYIDPNPGLNSPTSIAFFAWTGLIPGLTNALGGVIERGRDTRAHSDWIQDRMAFDIRLVAPDLGVFFSDAVD